MLRLSTTGWWRWTLLLFVVAIGATHAAGQAPADPPAALPVKVFVLAGQSNMEGQAVADLGGKDYNDGKGTLVALLNDPATAPLVRHLRDAKGTWVTRDDVRVRYQPERGPSKTGPLGLGFTPYGGAHHFGPELQFGHVVGNALANDVLLIKTAWGGKSLHVDFRPPSAGGTTGPYYTLMIQQVKEALAELARENPPRRYELAGFVWYHGWNDGCDPEHAVPAYESNLVHLIEDVRRECAAPNLPVVVGEITGPWVKAEGAWDRLRKAQAAAAAHPECKGTVAFVPTHEFVRRAEDSPNPGHGHHEFGNAETYVLVGDALGRAMLRLITPASDPKALGPGRMGTERATPHLIDDLGGLRGVSGRLVEGTPPSIATTAIAAGSVDARFLTPGDVILGVGDRRFEGDAVADLTKAVKEARQGANDHRLTILLRRTGPEGETERALPLLVLDAPPDVAAASEKPRGVPKDPIWDLGPTGARGWIFGREFDTSDARQILVTSVDAGSPADGVLVAGDVILGVDGAPFTSDARVAFGRAITAAESVEGKGMLTILRSRAGATTTVTVQLAVLGSYAATSPEDCPKAAALVEAGCKAILKRGLRVRSHDIRPDNWSPDIPTSINALALLASGDPAYLPVVREYAQTIAPETLDLDLQEGLFAWTWGYANLLATEYYLATKDEAVLPAIREYAKTIAEGQSLVGTWGHGFRVEGNHGTLGGYGAVNQAGLICWMSLALAQRCGIHEPVVDAAVERSREFFAFYTGKGSVPYGDHPPYWLHDDNGKSSSAAITFGLLGDHASEAFFTRMATAAYGEKELGHTGNYFGYLWGALAVHRAGPEALAAFLAEQRWYYDLARRWDGSFFTTSRDNYDWDMTGVFVLHAAAPRHALMITGKDLVGTAAAATPRSPLRGAELAATIASGRDFPLGRLDIRCPLASTEELLRDLGDWSPTLRHRAAMALAARFERASAERDETIAALTRLLRGDDRNAQYGACVAIQALEGRATATTDALIELLQSDDRWLRIRAAFALASIGGPAARAVPELLRRSVLVDANDPRGMEAKYLSLALFRADFVDQVPPRPGLLAQSMQGVDRALVYPAIRRMLSADDGLSTMTVRSIFRTLTVEELSPLLPDILHAAATTPPSGEMFAHEIRVDAMRFLAKHRIAAGLPILLDYVTTQSGWGNRTKELLPLFAEYGPDAAPLLPDLRRLEAGWKAKEAAHPDEAENRPLSAIAGEVIAAIETAAGGATTPAQQR